MDVCDSGDFGALAWIYVTLFDFGDLAWILVILVNLVMSGGF